MYTVKSNELASEIRDVLNNQKISLVVHEDNSIDVEVKNEREADIFFNVLAYYIAYLQIKEIAGQYYQRNGVKKKENNRLVIKMLNDASLAKYFFVITRILVREYFKTMSTINLNAFARFNIKGMKEEIEHVAQRLFEYSKKESMESKNIKEITEEEASFINVSEVVARIQNNPADYGINLDDFQILHVTQINGTLHFENDKKTVIDNNWMDEHLGLYIGFELEDDTPNRDIVAGILFLTVMVSAFLPKGIIIHQSVISPAKDLLIYNLEESKKELNLSMKIGLCTGCDRCHPHHE